MESSSGWLQQVTAERPAETEMYIPPGIFTRILSLTDVRTCFNFHDMTAAREILSTAGATEIAFRDFLLSGSLDHIRLLASLQKFQVGQFILSELACNNQLSILQFLAEKNLVTLALPIKEQSLQWHPEEARNDIFWSVCLRKPLLKAVLNNNEEMVTWMYRFMEPRTDYEMMLKVMKAVIRHTLKDQHRSDYTAIKAIVRENPIVFTAELIDIAEGFGHLGFLQSMLLQAVVKDRLLDECIPDREADEDLTVREWIQSVAFIKVALFAQQQHVTRWLDRMRDHGAELKREV